MAAEHVERRPTALGGTDSPMADEEASGIDDPLSAVRHKADRRRHGRQRCIALGPLARNTCIVFDDGGALFEVSWLNFSARLVGYVGVAR
jgi:hypothetical protein